MVVTVERSLPSRQDLELLREYQERSRTHPWLTYEFTAVPAILPWHLSDADIRVLAGPNRGGKTTAGAFELVSYATGWNPIRNEHYPYPNVCWGVCLDLKSLGKVMIRKLIEMLPVKKDGTPNWKYHKQDSMFTLGPPWHSEIHIKNQEDGPERFYGEGCTAIWVDEGKAGDTGQENFNEMLARQIPDQPLKIIVTLTPLNGYGWFWRRLWDKDSRDFIQGTFRHKFTIWDCLKEKGGFWTREQVESFSRSYPEHEKLARLEGEFIQIGTNPAFSPRLLMAAMNRCGRGKDITPKFLSSKRPVLVEEPGPLRVFRPRESGHSYIAGWDPAGGIERDHHGFAIIDRADLAVVAEAEDDTMDPALFAQRVVLPASAHYNKALLVPEVNGQHGGAALEAVRDVYENIYIGVTWDKVNSDISNNLGWRTTEQTRGRIIDALTRTLREGQWEMTPRLIDTMSHMFAKPTANGIRVEHGDGFQDDLAFAVGIALAVHYEEPEVVYPDFEKLRVKYKPVDWGGAIQGPKVITRHRFN